MSRIGKQPISLPSGLEVQVSGREVAVKGSKGELRYRLPEQVEVDVENGTLTVSRRRNDRVSRAMHGLARARLANAVRGVDQGFRRVLEIEGTGYRAEIKGQTLEMQLGYSHPIVVEPPDGIQFVCESPTRIVVSGIDKVLVGQVASNVRRHRPPEPYKGKGIRYEGEQIRRKAGKSGAAG